MSSANRFQRLAFVTLLSVFVLVSGRGLGASHWNGACDTDIDLGGAGVCTNSLDQYQGDNAEGCEGNCACFCANTYYWSNAHNQCNELFPTYCDPTQSYEWCSGESGPCGDSGKPCCGDLFCNDENYCVQPMSPNELVER